MSNIKLNRKLNLVIPVELEPELRGEGGVLLKPAIVVYVHSTPLGRETFEAFFDIFGRAFTQIYAGGYGITSGPRLTKLILTQTAKRMGRLDGEFGVTEGLFPEIRRLSNVVVPSGGKWQPIPLEDAITQGTFSDDDLSEVENALCFFMLASAMHKKAELRGVLEGMAFAWGARVESLNCTDFATSLPTSTPTDNTGEKAKLSSIPS